MRHHFPNLWHPNPPCLHSAKIPPICHAALWSSLSFGSLTVDALQHPIAILDEVAFQIVHSYWFSRTSTTIWYHSNTFHANSETVDGNPVITAERIHKTCRSMARSKHDPPNPWYSSLSCCPSCPFPWSFSHLVSVLHHKTITDGSCIVAQVSAGVLSPPGPLR